MKRTWVWVSVAVLAGWLLPSGAAAAPTADFNDDGMLTVPDVQCALLTVLGSLAGDAETPSCLAIPLADADVDGSGEINVSDVLFVINAILTGVDVEGPATVADAALGDILINEVMINPGSLCTDSSDEYIELRNTTAEDIELQGLVIEWGTSTMTITEDLVLEASGVLVGFRKAQSPCYSQFGAFELTLALTNSGKKLSLYRPDGALIDDVDFTGWSSIDSGVALAFDPSLSESTDNDSQENWCDQWTQIREDFGTPDLPNNPCEPGPMPPVDPAACGNNSDCTSPEQCLGIVSVVGGPIGECADPNPSVTGLGDNCFADADCGAGLTCVGEIRFAPDPGFCLYSWVEGTFYSEHPLLIPGAANPARSSVVAYGLATVPLDILVEVDLDHPRPEDLEVVLVDPNGSEVLLWSPGEAQNGPTLLDANTCCIPGDDTVGGKWWLEVTDTGSGMGKPGVLQSWNLYLSSNFD